MNTFLRRGIAFAFTGAITAAPSGVLAQTFALDPSSASLAAIPATSSDLLIPSSAPPALPTPLVGLSAAEFGLLPGDVIDAVWFFDDSGLLGPATLYFNVDRASVGVGVVGPPDVTSEVVFVPPGTQGEAASDVFVSNDPVCSPLGFNHQILDGDGALLGLPSICGYGSYGLGLTELLPTPPPPFNDAIADFDWGLPGRARLFCIGFSLAPGSSTLTPAANPLFPLGAEPGDLLVSCPGGAPASSPALFMGSPAAGIGLISGGPGCAPPACDDIDALGAGFNFSLSPGSPSVTAGPMFSAADLLAPGAPPAVVLPAAGMGLLPADNVTGLESFVNPCPIAPGLGSDFDLDAIDLCDNCPLTFNPGQEDSDGDGVGDACDPCTDTDADGFGNMDFPANLCATDLCPFNAGPNVDTDLDGWADECDNCVLVANSAQTDTDFDGVGDACDNCPIDPNFAQTDTDGDTFGDACDICTAGVSVTKPQLKITKLTTPGSSGMQIKGVGAFAGAVPIPPVDVSALGMRVQVVDTGNNDAVLFDHSIPAGLLPTICGTKDGWKVNGSGTSEKYSNSTNSVQPGCIAGSGEEVTKAGVNDKTASLKGVGHKLQRKNVTLPAFVGPFRVVVVYGGGAEEAAGQCSEVNFSGAECALNGSGTTLTCKP